MITVTTSAPGYLQGWVDFDGSGMWDPGEQVFTDRLLLAQVYERPSGFRSTFCRVCGSPLPVRNENGKVVGIPAGALDDDPAVSVVQHTFVDSKAGWDVISGDAPQYTEAVPPYEG